MQRADCCVRSNGALLHRSLCRLARGMQLAGRFALNSRAPPRRPSWCMTHCQPVLTRWCVPMTYFRPSLDTCACATMGRLASVASGATRGEASVHRSRHYSTYAYDSVASVRKRRQLGRSSPRWLAVRQSSRRGIRSTPTPSGHCASAHCRCSNATRTASLRFWDRRSCTWRSMRGSGPRVLACTAFHRG